MNLTIMQGLAPLNMNACVALCEVDLHKEDYLSITHNEKLSRDAKMHLRVQLFSVRRFAQRASDLVVVPHAPAIVRDVYIFQPGLCRV